MALRVISLPRSKQVAFGEEQASNGSRHPQSRSKMPQLGHLASRRVDRQTGLSPIKN